MKKQLAQFAQVSLLAATTLNLTTVTFAHDREPEKGVRIECELRDNDNYPATVSVTHTDHEMKAAWITASTKPGDEKFSLVGESQNGSYYTYAFQVITKNITHSVTYGEATTPVWLTVAAAPFMVLYPIVWAVFGDENEYTTYKKQLVTLAYNSADPAHSEALIQSGESEKTTRFTQSAYDMGKQQYHPAVCRSISLAQ